MKKEYIAPSIECLRFSNTDNTNNITLNQSAVFNSAIGRGIGENSAVKVFGVGKDIGF